MPPSPVPISKAGAVAYRLLEKHSEHSTDVALFDQALNQQVILENWRPASRRSDSVPISADTENRLW